MLLHHSELPLTQPQVLLGGICKKLLLAKFSYDRIMRHPSHCTMSVAWTTSEKILWGFEKMKKTSYCSCHCQLTD
jgi:hypothetical protein